MFFDYEVWWPARVLTLISWRCACKMRNTSSLYQINKKVIKYLFDLVSKGSRWCKPPPLPLTKALCLLSDSEGQHVFMFSDPFAGCHSAPDQVLHPTHCRWLWQPPNQTDDQKRFGSKDGVLVCACLSASSSSPEKTPVLPIRVTTCLHTPTLSGSHLHFPDHKWATLPPLRPRGSSCPPAPRSAHRPPGLVFLGCCLIVSCFIPLLYLLRHPVLSTISLFSHFPPFLLICCVNSLGS